MIVVGLSWLLFWLMISVFSVAVDKSALVTALIFIILGVLDYGGIRQKL